ncbi:MAG: Phage tail sheath protein [Thermoleophilia bacterium]|nr:Phage tail sheath protein [Thermoleophilia bacterium]
MPAPGVSVISDVQRALRGAPTNTGVGFLVGPTSAGTAGVPQKLNSLADLQTLGFGTRTGVGIPTYDAAEVFFNEGGAELWLCKTSASGTVVTAAQALETFNQALGPGQVFSADAADNSALLAHAATHNRVALLNGGGTVTTGPAVGGNTVRQVPPSPFVAGLIARSDAVRSVNEAPAGDRGYLRGAIDVVRPASVADVVTAATTAAGSTGSEYGAIFTAGRFTDAERATLDEAEVNPFVVGLSGVQLYGYNGLPADSFFTNARLRMALTARMAALGQQFVFKTINPSVIGAFRDVLAAELLREYKAGQLFGLTAEDAYNVDVSDAINTPTTIAAGELKAVVSYVPGPFAERVQINLTALPIPAATAV